MQAVDGNRIITLRDMSVDDVDSGLPRVTFTPSDGSRSQTFLLAPDAVTALVDALSGVAEPSPGEVRIIVKARAADLVGALRKVSV